MFNHFEYAMFILLKAHYDKKPISVVIKENICKIKILYNDTEQSVFSWFF